MTQATKKFGKFTVTIEVYDDGASRADVICQRDSVNLQAVVEGGGGWEDDQEQALIDQVWQHDGLPAKMADWAHSTGLY